MMPEREWHKGHCVSCGTSEVEVTTCNRPTGCTRHEETAEFCKYCYKSLAGNAHWWPEHYEGSITLVIVQVAHVLEQSILEKLGAGEKRAD